MLFIQKTSGYTLRKQLLIANGWWQNMEVSQGMLEGYKGGCLFYYLSSNLLQIAPMFKCHVKKQN